jgi:hypothetical protein
VLESKRGAFMKTISERLEFLREELGHYKACSDISSFYSSRIPQLEAEIRALEQEQGALTRDDCALLMSLVINEADSKPSYDKTLERLHQKLMNIGRNLNKK